MSHLAMLFLLLSVIEEAHSARFSTILRRSNRVSLAADPYAWELQTNAISMHSCFPSSVLASETPDLLTVRDTECVGFSDSHSKCRGGFPFFRFPAGDEKMHAA